MRTHTTLVLLVTLGVLASAVLGACGDPAAPPPAGPADAAPPPAVAGTVDGGGTVAEAPGPKFVDATPYLDRAAEALTAAESADSRAEALARKQAARRAYSEALLAGVSADDDARIRPRLEALTDEILDADTPIDGVSFAYEVKSGETLWKLCNPGQTFAKKGARLEPGFVCWLNGLSDPSRLRAGQTLHVPVGEFELVVEKHRFRLLVFYGGTFVKSYPVGLGKQDRTPEGEFVVQTKLEKPTWTSPENVVIPYGSPKNPLGTRWMGFENKRTAWGYGIHGTSEPDTIGKQSSNGCIRMLDADVKELFSWAPRGTKVLIRR